MSSIHRSAIVPYSDHEMFALVADIASYPEFLPWCGGARIRSHTEDMVEAEITIAYSGVHKTFSTRNLLQKNKMMEIRLLEGPFKHLQGHWRFTALDERSSKVTLDLDFEVSNRLLSVVLTPVFSSIATQMVDAFHARAIALYGRR
jgi:coenzyme Q-binding protein COQ10